MKAAAVMVTDGRVADWDQFTVMVMAAVMVTDEKKNLPVKIFSWDGLQGSPYDGNVTGKKFREKTFHGDGDRCGDVNRW